MNLIETRKDSTCNHLFIDEKHVATWDKIQNRAILITKEVGGVLFSVALLSKSLHLVDLWIESQKKLS